MGYQVIDALGTLLISGLEEEYKRAAEWIRVELSWDQGGEYNTFEVSLLRWVASVGLLAVVPRGG